MLRFHTYYAHQFVAVGEVPPSPGGTVAPWQSHNSNLILLDRPRVAPGGSVMFPQDVPFVTEARRPLFGIIVSVEDIRGTDFLPGDALVQVAWSKK